MLAGQGWEWTVARDDSVGTPPEAADTEVTLRILVVRSGGFAGIPQQWRVDPVTDSAEVAEWTELLDACPWGLPREDPASADRFIWRIEAWMPRVAHSASVPDAQLVGPWRTLVDRVQNVGLRGPARD